MSDKSDAKNNQNHQDSDRHIGKTDKTDRTLGDFVDQRGQQRQNTIINTAPSPPRRPTGNDDDK